ncbi:mechanosensitive ion channel protein MscS [Niastella vici]|uniref:Mechanosensitive ion channel protein MscS n=1 Tax=Niastella vici TaxID=1703345 RepID=A0A1V9FFD6_9BACT|nr:mechanosensitive ion channel [Niastella vici]OQP56936.1 mechanosensitive ion channel protein MscS [Niastella vici]
MEKWIALIKEKLESWLTTLVKMLPNLVLAILVAVTFYLVARLLRKLMYKLLLKISHKAAISGLFSSIFFILILLIGFFISLQLLHLEKTIASMLAGAGIIGLALGFAFQDLTANFISGVFIIFRKPFDVGNIIDTNGFTGIVEEIQLRSTTIRTFDGLHIMLPNKEIFQKPVTNYSLSGKRRIDVTLTVPGKSNVNDMERRIQHALEEIPEVRNDKSEVLYTDYNGDAIKLEVHCWIDNTIERGYFATRDKVLRAVHAAMLTA